MEPLTWLITGASSGLGFELTLHVLAAGHRAIGTVRNRTKSSDAVSAIEKAGGKVIELDVTNAEAIPGAAASASAIYNTIDVLVNNAGYSILGAMEDMKLASLVLSIYLLVLGLGSCSLEYRLIAHCLPFLLSLQERAIC